MVRADVQARTLSELYLNLRTAQQQAHGADYTLHHRWIWCHGKGGGSYAELGVNQGATLACALLSGFRRVVGIDINLWLLEPHRGLFDRAILTQRDSREAWFMPVDFLFIDTVHTVEHVAAELAMHAARVRQRIMVHDTEAPGLYTFVATWAADHGWTVEHRETRSVGFTVLKR